MHSFGCTDAEQRGLGAVRAFLVFRLELEAMRAAQCSGGGCKDMQRRPQALAIPKGTVLRRHCG